VRVHINDKGGRSYSDVYEISSAEELHAQLEDLFTDLDFDSIHIFPDNIQEKDSILPNLHFEDPNQKEIGHHDAITTIKALPDGKHFISASRDCTIKLWDIATVSCIKTYRGHNGPVTDIDFL